MEREIEVEISPRSPIRIVCGNCKTFTQHEVISSVRENYKEAWGPSYDFDATTWYQVVRCRGCESLVFRRSMITSEDDPVFVGPGHDDWEFVPQVEIYPSSEESRQLMADDHLLPSQIQRIYEESLRSLNSHQPILCGIGIRSIIECVARDQAATGKDLYNKIEDLVSHGVLTRDGAGILQKLRVIGNKAAHEVKPHSKEQLSLAMDVIEHLLQGTYILPKHANLKFD